MNDNDSAEVSDTAGPASHARDYERTADNIKNKIALIPASGQPLPTGESKARSVQALFDVISQRYDRVNSLMTFGLDKRWRKRSLDSLNLAPNSLIADLACGTGDFLTLATLGGYRSVGFDFSMGMLKNSKQRCHQLIQADVTRMPVANSSFDAVTCGFALRNLVDLDVFFSEVARIVRPGGSIALLDVSRPNTAILRYGFDIYFNRVVPIIGRILSNRDAYSYLPRSLSYLPDSDTLCDKLGKAGFVNVEHRQLSGGLVQLLSAKRAL